jgi:hypothetical protein
LSELLTPVKYEALPATVSAATETLKKIKAPRDCRNGLFDYLSAVASSTDGSEKA